MHIMGLIEDIEDKLRTQREAETVKAGEQATLARQTKLAAEAENARQVSAQKALAERKDILETAATSRLTASLKPIDPEKLLTQVRTLWGTGKIDDAITVSCSIDPALYTDPAKFAEINPKTDPFFVGGAAIGINHRFGFFREHFTSEGIEKYDEGGSYTDGYRQVSAGFKRENGNLGMSIGIANKRKLVAGRWKEEPGIFVAYLSYHCTASIGFNREYDLVQGNPKEIVAAMEHDLTEAYPNLPTPHGILPNQKLGAHENIAFDSAWKFVDLSHGILTAQSSSPERQTPWYRRIFR